LNGSEDAAAKNSLSLSFSLDMKWVVVEKQEEEEKANQQEASERV
jgi:hypothetical protein